MYKLKLAATGVFTIAFIAFTFYRTVDVAGQTTLAAPTNVLATDNMYNNKVGIYWDVIRNATAYRIFRNTINDPNSATDVGTTAAPYFFDASAAPNTTFFYWVRA